MVSGLTYCQSQGVCRTYNCKQYAGSACDELKHVRQAVAPLILDDRQNPDTSCLDQGRSPMSWSTSYQAIEKQKLINIIIYDYYVSDPEDEWTLQVNREACELHLLHCLCYYIMYILLCFSGYRSSSS
ncbi:uncharacterized protein LOC120655943 [Panicum virgatum]|uniref:uncharacterized protein LOC120655943 n=1 Tax=Panicum virgatum TaxID=38727 RepID=UPI0019D50B4C|nr:uncharacterized protein LOC120655943 [Panicum virgatum]